MTLIPGVLLSSALASPAAADVLRHTVRFDARQVHVTTTLEGPQVRAGDLPRTWERGLPELPYTVVTWLVPQGSRVVGARAHAVGERVLATDVDLAPAAPRTDSDGRSVSPPPPLKVGSPERSIYPLDRVEVAGTGALHGYQLASVRVYPVRYDLATRQLVASERVDVELEIAPGGARPLERARYREAVERDARRQVRRLVVNPEAIPGYARGIGERIASTQRGFRPTQAPSLEGSPVDYVIITDPALETEFQTFADWKTRRGIPTVVRTTDWIEANYRHGSDLQETIRTFIQDAYAKWGVQYVLLGGDTDVIPARHAWSLFAGSTESDIPTDMYFACLDGNWNLDRDALWGEAALDSVNLNDDPDLYAEVYVGRIPVSTASEANLVLGKILEYENPTVTNYQDEVLLLSEVLFPVDWTTGQTITMDGASFSEDIGTFLPACAAVTRLYQNDTFWPGALPLTRAATIAELNKGYGFVNHIGHGFRYNMSVGDASLVNADAMALTNGSERFILYFLNCTATAFDFPSLAEAFLKAPGGGAVAVLGSSRAAFPLPSYQYNRQFFIAFHQDSTVNIGRTFVESRLPYTPNAFQDNADHYTHYIYNMLADPEMVMHSCSLGTTAVTHPTTLALGSNNVLVNVTVDGVPREGALVALQKGVEEYVHGRTDANGDVALTFVAESAGSVDVTVSGQNMTTYLGSMTVDATGGAYVHATTMTFDDDDVGTSIGNGDGVLDAAETVGVDVSFRNDGDATASGVTGVFRIDSPWATVLDSTYTLGTVTVAGTAASTAELRFAVLSNAPDGTVLPLRFESTDGSSTWTDVINKVVHAPRMDYTLLTVDDSAPGGNGDGIIQAGETLKLFTSFKNYGTGAANGLDASIITGDPDLVILNNFIVIGDAVPQQEVTSTQFFQVTENDVSAENVMLMILRDRYSRVWTFKVSLRPPAKPATPVLDASEPGVVVATWTPSTEPDLAGYHVYRAQDDSTAAFSRITVDRTAGVAYYRDQGLLASTQYFYRVTAIDSAGNESLMSDIAGINTVPAQLGQYPIVMGAESSCPPAVGDITGDGQKDVVAGNDHLYAWDAQGVELRDDDQDPQTWGVFASEIDIITAAVALGEMDFSSPGFEVFVTVWDDTNKAYIVRGDGSFVPGWPQNPDPGTAQLGYWGAPGVMDVDGDGRAEVFAPAKNGNLYAWHADGTPLGASPAWKTGLGTFSRCSPTFANLDMDPQPEIVFGSPVGVLNVWNADGSSLANFPQTLGTVCLSSTAIGDVDADGTLDIVMITEGGDIHVIDSATGTELPGWPAALSISSNPISPSPALADFDGDGKLEIVVANNAIPVTQSAVRIYDWQGNVLPGWPQFTGQTSSESSPIVADFTGDGVPDVIFGNESGKIYGWDKDGNSISGFPLSTGDFVRSTPTAADLDGDGDIELVLAGWDRNLYVWDFPVAWNAAAAQWPTLKHDAQRSGFYGFRTDSPTDIPGDDGGPAGAPAPPRAVLAQNVPNPFNPMTRIEYGVPAVAGAAARVPVTLDVYDVRGQRVRRLVEAPQRPGMHRVVWDGRDGHGRRAESGVYFYRLRAGAESVTRKMLLLK